MTHEWDVKTAYYSAKVPIWVDEIPDTEAWRDEFLKPEAKEVIEAVGAWIYCFNKPSSGAVSVDVEGVMKAIQSISKEHAGYGGDTVMLAVAIPHSKAALIEGASADSDEWEDVCMQYGFEYIDYAAQGKNSFGEKVGFERLKEALEANEWTSTTDEADELNINDLDFNADDDFGDFGTEEAEMTAELFGMKAALTEEDDAFEPPDVEDLVPSTKRRSVQVDDLDSMMGKLLAVREQCADLPEAQRKRMAKQAVEELMMGDAGL